MLEKEKRSQEDVHRTHISEVECKVKQLEQHLEEVSHTRNNDVLKELQVTVQEIGIFCNNSFSSKALQLQRSFGLLNECLPFDPVSDAVLPVCYFHPFHVAFYINLLSIFLVFLAILLVRVTTCILFLPCCYLAYNVHVQTKLIFVL